MVLKQALLEELAGDEFVMKEQKPVVYFNTSRLIIQVEL